MDTYIIKKTLDALSILITTKFLLQCITFIFGTFTQIITHISGALDKYYISLNEIRN